MNVMVFDSVGNTFQITTDSPAVLGAWFAEMATRLQTANAAHLPYRMNIYPTGDFDPNEWTTRGHQLTAVRCRWLSRRFQDWQEEDSA